MQKIDLKKELKEFYHASAKEVKVVDVPAFSYLMIDGQGDPNTSPEYAQAVETLFTISYAAKFQMKKDAGIDYVVMPLEGLWWADDMSVFEANNRAAWKWAMMIVQPGFVPTDVIEAAMVTAKEKKGHLDVTKVRFEKFVEGRAAQVLHVGPFSEEGPTIQRLHDFINERSSLRGKHHEIYLSDVRRAEPAKWRTILRQPMN